MRAAMMTFRRIAAIALAPAAVGASGACGQGEGAASPPVLDFPLDCDIGVDCWAAQYVDLDPGSGARDPMCGPRAYDGHKGVDIAIADMSLMARGVEVRAAAGGVVRGVRDGERDRLIGRDEPMPTERECGNGVRIEHPGGWTTQYCHMKEGSIAVAADDVVAAGARLGAVGASGATQFPHLHVTVRDPDDAVRDPFTGRAVGDACDAPSTPLWRDADFVYQPVIVSRAGFAFGRASSEAAVAGDYAGLVVTPEIPALVGWGEAWGVRGGDVLMVSLIGPDGATLARNEDAVPHDQARRFAFAGVRRPEEGWAAGDYVVEVALIRAGAEPLERRRRETVTMPSTE